MRSGRFQLYDYGSPAANAARYGADAPPDVAALYPLLAGLPVDLVAGRSDGVIAREDVVRVSVSVSLCSRFCAARSASRRFNLSPTDPLPTAAHPPRHLSPPSPQGAHYDAMAAAGLDVSLKELDVGHLDVTFAAKEEVTGYVLARLGLRPGAAAAAAAAVARAAGA